MTDLAKVFGQYGGLCGLVLLALFSMIAYLIFQLTKVIGLLLESDARIIDFKRETYKVLPYKDRRKYQRNDQDDEP